MIRQTIKIQRYDWAAYIYYAVSCYHADEIVHKMMQVGCDPEDVARAYDNMVCDKLDNGITFSNYNKRHTVQVIGLTSSAKEFTNSYVHEIRHLVNHICQTIGIPLDSEESCYLAGHIAGEMFEYCKHLMCDGCRKIIYKPNKYNDYELKVRSKTGGCETCSHDRGRKSEHRYRYGERD